jgi:hypothetical protein
LRLKARKSRRVIAVERESMVGSLTESSRQKARAKGKVPRNNPKGRFNFSQGITLE